MMPIKIQRIRTERHPNETSFQLRNRPRVVLEVDVIPQNGKILLGRFCPMGTSRLEVYEDEIEVVLAKVKTKQAAEALILAATLCKGYREEWANENSTRRRDLAKMSTEDREEYIDLNANLRPEMFVGLASAGEFRTMVGAVNSVRVVATDEVSMLTVPEFRELSDEERNTKWLIEPPATMANSAERAAGPIAKAFADVLRELKLQSGTSEPEPRAKRGQR
jgi:hypothetical protein